MIGSRVVLVDLPGAGSVLQRVTVAARIRARLRVAALDRALAGGAVTESDVALTLHARRLISPTTRRQLAHTLRGIVESSQRPSRWPGARVAAAGSELLALAERLERREAVDARGVARLRVLLSDGGGPLQVDRGAHGLAQAALEILVTLEPEGAPFTAR